MTIERLRQSNPEKVLPQAITRLDTAIVAQESASTEQAARLDGEIRDASLTAHLAFDEAKRQSRCAVPGFQRSDFPLIPLLNSLRRDE